jgi:hypothetical protein
MDLPTIPTPNGYFKIIIGFVVLLLSFCSGIYVEHLRYMDYKEGVVAQEKVQEQHNKDLIKQRDLENAKIKSDYSNQLAVIKRLYNTSSSKLPGPSATLVSVNGYTTDPVFAQQCADTTAQLISLQQWVKDQVGLQ